VVADLFSAKSVVGTVRSLGPGDLAPRVPANLSNRCRRIKAQRLL